MNAKPRLPGKEGGANFAAKLQIVADRNFKIGRMFDGPIYELLFAADGIVCKNENAKTEKFWLFPNNDRFWIGIKVNFNSVTSRVPMPCV